MSGSPDSDEETSTARYSSCTIDPSLCGSRSFSLSPCFYLSSFHLFSFLLPSLGLSSARIRPRRPYPQHRSHNHNRELFNKLLIITVAECYSVLENLPPLPPPPPSPPHTRPTPSWATSQVVSFQSVNMSKRQVYGPLLFF